MRSEEDIKNCTTNGVPNETIIGRLTSEIETYKKALMLACEELGGGYCCEDDFKHKCDNDCATHWRECFMQEARESNE